MQKMPQEMVKQWLILQAAPGSAVCGTGKQTASIQLILQNDSCV